MTPCSTENSAASARQLRPGDIHLWTVDLNEWIAAGAFELLSPAEQAIAVRHRSQTARTRFITRRAALREILARYAGVPPTALQFASNAFGKPELRGPSSRISLAFNTSHSGGLAVVAIAATEPLGIDIEELRADIEIDSIAVQFFAAGEVAAIAELNDCERVLAFYNAWTRKEAIVKALGNGLSIALDRFEVSVRPGVPPAIIKCAFDPRLGERLQLRQLQFGNGHVGALALGAGEFAVRHYTWQGKFGVAATSKTG